MNMSSSNDALSSFTADDLAILRMLVGEVVDGGTNCRYYGRFLYGEPKETVEAVFWIAWLTTVGLLSVVSLRFQNANEQVTRLDREIDEAGGVPRPGQPADEETSLRKVASDRSIELDAERARILEKLSWIVFICCTSSIGVVVLAAMSLLTLQFCQREPLINMYFAAWTVIGVGSTVATMGITLQVRHLKERRPNPPWALALGTPVLVVAGLTHYLHKVSIDAWRSYKAKRAARQQRVATAEAK